MYHSFLATPAFPTKFISKSSFLSNLQAAFLFKTDWDLSNQSSSSTIHIFELIFAILDLG